MTAPVIVVMPGASLMQISRHDSGAVTVRCPGCAAAWRWHPSAPAVQDVAFRHLDDACPVLAKINAALERQESGA